MEDCLLTFVAAIVVTFVENEEIDKGDDKGGDEVKEDRLGVSF